MNPAEIASLAQNAETIVWEGFRVVWEERLRLDMADSLRDTSKTGMIGLEYTPLTSTLGNEVAKELSTRHGWASWILRQLIAKGVKRGDRIAISMTGSFPALNLAALAALQTLGVQVTGIASIGSSSWGANEIGFSWPEIERLLVAKGTLKVSCSAVTFGGTGDRGLEWDETTGKLAMQAVKRCGLPLLKPRNLRDAVKKRMLFYGKPEKFACFINIGGGQATLGAGAKMRYTRGGWFVEPLGVKGDPDGVMDKFLEAGIPCLNLLYLDDLNRREGILQR